MKCKKCGVEISENTKFCPECGEKVEKTKVAKTIQLRCKECNGTMTTDEDRTVLSCPFCGSKEIVQESDAVTIERIKNKTKKEIALAKMQHESEKEQKRYEREKEKYEQSQKEKESEQYNNFRKGNFSKILIASFIISLMCTILAFRNFRILQGLIALTQTGLFATSWLMGMGFVKEKIPRIQILLAILGYSLIVLYLASNSVGGKNKKINSPSISEEETTNEKEGIHSYKIRDYTGKNAASIGKTDSQNRVDEYGCGELRIAFVTEDGLFLDPFDDEQLKEYTVSGQNIKPDTTITIVNLRNYEGKPFSNLVDYQSYDEIVLFVNKIGEKAYTPEYTQLKPVLDRHEAYVRDYVGRNAVSFGKTFQSERIDCYREGELRIVFVSDDGEYIDINDENCLKQYVVIGQSLDVNTKLEFEYEKNSSGEEYDNLINSQNYEEITLRVKKLADNVIDKMSNPSQNSSATDNSEKKKESEPSKEPVDPTPNPMPAPTPAPSPKPEPTNPSEEKPKGITKDDISTLIHYDFVNNASDINSFATTHKGEEIELELLSAYVENNENYKTRFNYLLYAVDGDDVMLSGPAFMFKDVSYYDLNLTGSNKPDVFGIGIHCKVKAEIDGYEDGMFLLDPVSISVIKEY